MIRVLIFLQILALSPGFLSAQESGVFLKLPYSARGAGMGDAYTAIAEGPLGIYYNPAGLARTKHVQVSAARHVYLQDISGNTFGAAVPLKGYVFGVAPTYFRMKNEQIFDPFGNDTGRAFAYSASVFPVAVARNLGPLSVGAGVKTYRERIDETSARADTLDLGAQLGLGRLRLGYAAQNLRGKAFGENLVKIRRLGAAYDGSGFLLAADSVKEGAFGSYVNLGAEAGLLSLLRLRGGVRIRDEFGGPTFGLGIDLGGWALDYAFAGYGDLGDTHRVGLSYEFGVKKADVSPVIPRKSPRAQGVAAPALTWTGEENHYSSGLSTTAGNTGTDFVYRVRYSDADGDAPSGGYPRLHILKAGAGIIGSPFAMDYISGENKTGAIYSFTRKLPAGNDYAYYFEAIDTAGLSAAGPPVAVLPGPLVAQLEAERMSGGLNLAIAEFTGKNVSQADASIVGDFLRTELVNTGLFNVMDRNNMDTILAEQKFQNSGCTEQQCAVEMGKLLNVQKMLVGSLSKLLDTYYITVNVIDVETGKIGVSYDMDAANARELKDACQRIAAKIAGK